MQTKKLYSLVILLVIIMVVGYVYASKKEKTVVEIKTENVIYDNATSDLITVELPFPGAVTGKEFSVIGKARGNWFFEASFPVTVFDKDGNVLVETYASAEGEWMTTHFVPFKAEIKAPISYIGPATVVLYKNKPTDMRELDAKISFPFTIEY